MTDQENMLARVAVAISGAPFPSRQAKAKARAAIVELAEPTHAMIKAASTGSSEYAYKEARAMLKLAMAEALVEPA